MSKKSGLFFAKKLDKKIVGVGLVSANSLVEGLTGHKMTRLVSELNAAVRRARFKPKSAGRRARKKGHGFERDVAVLLKPLYPEARRLLENHSADARGVDLLNTGMLKIQCKKLKQYAPLTRIEEIECSPELGDVPVLVTAADSKPALACLPLDDFIRLLQTARGHGAKL